MAGLVAAALKFPPGGEAVIPGLKAMVDIGSELGINNFIFGMAHR